MSCANWVHLYLQVDEQTSWMHPQIGPARVGSTRKSNPARSDPTKWGQIRVGSVSGQARFQNKLTSSGRIGSIRAVCTPKSTENKSDAPPNRPNTGWIRPGRVKSGLDPSWVGPVFKKHSKTKRMFDHFTGSDRPNTGRMHPQIDRKRVGCTPKSAQHGSFAPASRPRHSRI